MHLVIIGLYAYVLFQIEESEYITMILLTVATCLSICYLKKSVVEGNSSCKVVEGNKVRGYPSKDKGSSMDKGFPQGEDSKEGFENAPKPGSNIVRQLPDVMGPYDGLCLQTGNRGNWMKTPDETALVPNDALFTFLGSQGPEKPVFSDNSALTGPTIDGHPDSAKKMFMFANNRSSPNCCPSTFSTSTGCVCTTKNQRDFIASRGITGQGGAINLQDI